MDVLCNWIARMDALWILSRMGWIATCSPVSDAEWTSAAVYVISTATSTNRNSHTNEGTGTADVRKPDKYPKAAIRADQEKDSRTQEMMN